MKMKKNNELYQVGAVIGKTSSSELQFVVDTEKTANRPLEVGEYVGIYYQNKISIGLIIEIVKENSEIIESLANSPKAVQNMKELAMNPGAEVSIATVAIQGFVNSKGTITRPRYPASPGALVIRDPDEILENALSRGQITIGTLRGNHNVSVSLDVIQLVSRHFSILAMTGAGKSYTVSVILNQLMLIFPSVSVVVIDPHEDYNYMKQNQDYGERVEIFTLTGKGGTRRIRFKVSNIDQRSLEEIIGIPKNATHQQAAYDRVYKQVSNNQMNRSWSLNDLREKLDTLSRNENINDKKIKDAAFSLKRRMRWIPEEDFLDSDIETPLAAINETALTKPGQLTIINPGLLGQKGKESLVKEILQRIFKGAIAWRRNTRNEQILGPVLIILEEAHQFIPPEEGSRCKSIIKQIAGEGRKFGVGIGIITQRPGKIDENILSQCNTQITLRITNPRDQNAIANASESISQELLNDLPSLNTGEAIITGSAIGLPSHVRISKLNGITTGGDDVPITSIWNNSSIDQESLITVEEEDWDF